MIHIFLWTIFVDVFTTFNEEPFSLKYTQLLLRPAINRRRSDPQSKTPCLLFFQVKGSALLTVPTSSVPRNHAIFYDIFRSAYDVLVASTSFIQSRVRLSCDHG